MLRPILAVAAGLATAFVVVLAGEAIGHWLYPPPPGVDVTKPEHLATLMEQLPAGAMAAILAAWAAGSFAGGAVAGRLGRHRGSGLLVGVGMLLAGAVTMIAIPHPKWFVLASVPIALVPAWLAGRLFAAAT